MKLVDLKNIAEFVGISALVASLVFVGLQMKQAQEIAKTENDMALLQSHIEIRTAMNEHAGVWTKAQTDQPLDSAERVIFQNLVIMLNNAAFFDYMRARRHDQADVAQVIVIDFAAFLFQHPSVRRQWLEREELLIRYRNAIAPDRNAFSFWKDSVTASLSKLDRRRGGERSMH